MADRTEGNVTIEGARIIFRNFQGKEGQYNAAGDRNFGVILSPEVAAAMLEDGWNVKELKVREEELAENPDAQPTPWISVSVNFDKGKPPKVVMITESRGRTNMDADMVEMLDWADIALDEAGNPKVDIIIRPYTWEVGGRTGVKAYLQTMFITIEEDALEAKYAGMDEQ